MNRESADRPRRPPDPPRFKGSQTDATETCSEVPRHAPRNRLPFAGVRCDACGCWSQDRAHGFVAYLLPDPDEVDPPEVITLCPTCAAVHFDYEAKVAYT